MYFVVEMENNISDFITVSKASNGRIKIAQTLTNEANTYRLLYKLGYRKTTINKKRIYFFRDGDSMRPISFLHIRDAFYKALKEMRFSALPAYADFKDVLNWFYQENPIKENGLSGKYLKEDLNENDELSLRLKIDVVFNHKYKINSSILTFEDLCFKNVEDEGCIKKGSKLYYKKVEGTKYLVFVHYNRDIKLQDGFDLYLADFAFEESIGYRKPKYLEDIRFSFDIQTDLPLIKNYISN
ncbi:MAG: hypothetical protein H7Y13_03890 [Sphingobacteriaceae bacterium]|nr:hypothetical protein [Sphingobacteriaceae bacterium]